MWASLVAAAIGVWLMASPAVLDFGGTAADSSRVAGPIVVSLGVMAASSILRGVRWGLILAGIWLLIAPWIIGYDMIPLVNALTSGAVLIVLPFLAKDSDKTYGGGWSTLLPGRDPDTDVESEPDAGPHPS